MGIGSEWYRQNWSDDDYGVGHQGRGEQIRHAGPQLRSPRWRPRTHPTGGPVRLRRPTQNHEPLPESSQFRTIRFRRLLCLLPG